MSTRVVSLAVSPSIGQCVIMTTRPALMKSKPSDHRLFNMDGVGEGVTFCTEDRYTSQFFRLTFWKFLSIRVH